MYGGQTHSNHHRSYMQCSWVHWSPHNIRCMFSCEHCKEHTPFPHCSGCLKTQGQGVVFSVPSRTVFPVCRWLTSLYVLIWFVLCAHPQKKRMPSVFLFFCHQFHHVEPHSPTHLQRTDLKCHHIRQVGRLQLQTFSLQPCIAEAWPLY